jgi:ElaB/YqjD/DUF883 family membrane-anchored ribosome-binding protein
MTDTSDDSTKEARERLEHQADATRARLLDHLDTLDDRRDRAKRFLEHASDKLKRHKALLIGVSVGVLVAVGLIAFARRRSAKQKPSYLFYQAVKNLLGPGYVVESVERRNHRVSGALAKAGMGVALRVASEVAKRQAPRERVDIV